MSENPSTSASAADSSSPESALPSSSPAAATPARRASAPWLWFVLLVLAALGTVGWQWYDTRLQVAALQDELARRLAEGEARNKEALALAKQAHGAAAELAGRVETLEGGLAESQNQQVALEALYQQLSRNTDEWALAEIEQTLTIAAQQLQLAGNVKSAILALQNADVRLQRIERPQLLPLRKVIERDIERLRVSPYVDVVGLSLKLDTLMEAVDTLPLAMQQRPPATPSETEAPEQGQTDVLVRLAREIWRDLRALVRIQTVDRPDLPLVDPGQEFFLRENLKLRLLSARMAVLQRDGRTYRADLLAARQWVERFYDTRDRNLVAVLTTLHQLVEVDIGIAAPDINASLNAVRDYRLTREKGPR